MFKTKFAQVNGTKKNRCVLSAQMLHRTEKEPSKEMQSLLGSKSFSIGVLSDDFAAVDFREELC